MQTLQSFTERVNGIMFRIQHLYYVGILKRASPGISFVKPCCTSSDNEQELQETAEHRTIGQWNKQKAEHFLKNLTGVMLEKKNSILMMIDVLRAEGKEMPERITAVDVTRLVKDADSIADVQAYMKYRYNVEQLKETERLLRNAEKEFLQEVSSNFENSTELAYDGRRWQHLNDLGAARSGLLGTPLVFDLDFSYSGQEEKASRSQLMNCYGKNRRHPCGFNLHFTSVTKLTNLHDEIREGFLPGVCVDFHEKPFWEIMPLDNIVYICPEAPMLQEYDGNSIYVIPGVEAYFKDKSHVLAAYARARKLGIRVGSLPLHRYGHLTQHPSRPLSVQQMFQVMLNVNLNHCWKKAFTEELRGRGFTEIAEES